MIQYKLKLEESTLKVLRHLNVDQLICTIENESDLQTEFYWDDKRNSYLTINVGYDTFLSNNTDLEEIKYETN